MIRAVFPGSFDPIHLGHMDIAIRGSRLFTELIVAVYDQPLKNSLFTPDERLELVRQTFIGVPNITVMGYSGLTVEFCHRIGAQAIVRGLRVFSDFEYEFRMALANNRLYPDIEVVALITNEANTFLSSSTVKEIASLGGDITTMVPPHVNLALKKKFSDLNGNHSVVQSNLQRD